MPNEITEPKSKSLMALQKNYISSIASGLADIIGNANNYQKVCGYNILTQINVQLAKENLTFQSPEVDKETINNAIKYAMVYSLNTDNREVFVIIRKEKRGKVTKVNERGQSYEADNWVKVVEVKPQYRGTLKIVATFGRDVKKVYPEWIVREGDEFTYPMFKGIKIVPPTWVRKDIDGKIVRVVVPIQYKDGSVDYRIAERESVAVNIKAQIKQSVMYDKDKEVILAKIQDMTLDELLADKTLANYVNETYTGLSKEEMLITKLVINAVKRVQLDYQSALARELNEKTFDNADVYKPHHNAEEVLAMTNAPMLDVQEVEVEEKAQEPEEPKPQRKVDEDGVVEELKKDPDKEFTSLFDDPDEN